MYRFIIVFYLVCFGVYVLFSRQPDYFDGELITGQVHFQTDSLTGKKQPLALFQLGKERFAVEAAYPLRSYREGEQVTLIYETAHPRDAAVYAWWGYWITWKECLASVALLVAGVFAAKVITSNPAPGHDEREDQPRTRKRRYTS